MAILGGDETTADAWAAALSKHADRVKVRQVVVVMPPLDPLPQPPDDVQEIQNLARLEDARGAKLRELMAAFKSTLPR